MGSQRCSKMGKSALELEREARIAANKQRMLECGLLQTVQAIATQQTEAAKVRRAAKATVKASRAARRAAGDSAGRVRRWAGLEGAWQHAGRALGGSRTAWQRAASRRDSAPGGRLLVPAPTVGTPARSAHASRPTVGPPPCSSLLPRRSERVAGLDAPNYNENERLLSLADPEGRGSRDRRLMRGASRLGRALPRLRGCVRSGLHVAE